MSDMGQKIPFSQSFNRGAEKVVLDAGEQLGRALPCRVVAATGSVVLVNFEIEGELLPQVTVPVASPEYIRLPLQPGDPGLVVPADARLGGLTGLGAGIADLSRPANLSALMFVPLGATTFFAVDGKFLVLYGKASNGGVIIRTVDGTITLTLGAGGIAIVGDTTIDGDLAVTGNISATGSIIAGLGGADQVSVQTHVHDRTQPAGPGNYSGAPKPGS